MFNIGYEFKNANGQVLATVINVVNRGPSHGFLQIYSKESLEVGGHYYAPLYVVKKPKKNGFTIVTISESVLAGKERWSEIDSVRDK